MPVKLYKANLSPPARAAMIGCELFNVPTEYIEVDLMQGQHLKPEYLKKNPLHTVPVLEDGDTIVHESHSILMYLADVYGREDSWYPKDPKKRSRVNQMLFFDANGLAPKLRAIVMPAFKEGQRKVSEQNLNDLDEAYKSVEEFLTRSKYIAGDNITIADISSCTMISSFNIIKPIDSKKYPKTVAWVKEVSSQPFYKKQNDSGETAYKGFLNSMLDL